jgi:hypothetical protein
MRGPKPRFTVEMLEALPPGLTISQQAERMGCSESIICKLRKKSPAHIATLGSKGRPVKFQASDLDGLTHLSYKEQMEKLGASKGMIGRLRSERSDHVKYRNADSTKKVVDAEAKLDGLLGLPLAEQAKRLGHAASTVMGIRALHPYYADETARLEFIRQVRKVWPDLDAVVRLAHQHATQKEN